MAPPCLVCQVGWWSRAPTSRSAVRRTVRATERQVSKFTAATATTAMWPARPPVCHASTACCRFYRSSLTAFSNRHSVFPRTREGVADRQAGPGCVDNLHCVSMNVMKPLTSGGRVRGQSNRLRSFVIWLCSLRLLWLHLCVSGVSAKLVEQQMFLWLNMAPRDQPAGVASLDTLTCQSNIWRAVCDYSGGLEEKEIKDKKTFLTLQICLSLFHTRVQVVLQFWC